MNLACESIPISPVSSIARVKSGKKLTLNCCRFCVSLICVLFLFFAVIPIFAQSSPAAQAGKPRLAILPFVGGAEGDGETVATLFSFRSEILEAFVVVPRTAAVNALVTEQNFQMSGYTDSDTIAGIGRMLNADFVVSGHIRRLGDRNLIITTFINVETFEQIVGDYREYRYIDEVQNMLGSIAGKMITAVQRDTSKLPSLAVAPFNIANQGVDIEAAETLAHILAVEIINTNLYAVLPRTSAMQSALKELDFQMSGATAEEGAKALGRAVNAEYVLSAEVRSLGAANIFTASILNAENGSLFTGGSRNYRNIDDGIKLMAELALLLSGNDAEARIAALRRQRARDATLGDISKLWSIGVSAGSAFATPLAIATVKGTIAPFKHSFLEIGIDAGFITTRENVDSYYSLFPYAQYAAFVPVGGKAGLYAGLGCGYRIAQYRYGDISVPDDIFAMIASGGLLLFDWLDINYTLATDFKSVGNKVSIGYIYRFK